MTGFVSLSFDLENPEPEDYETIKEELLKQGLKKKIVGKGGGTVELPSTTYSGKFDETPEPSDVVEWLKSAASKAGVSVEKYFALTTDGGWSWSGKG